MSKNEKETEQTEKFVTKYDRKMQKRQEQKQKEKKEKLVSTILGVVIVAALLCLVASFPIRTYMAVNETYIKVNGENISRVEFDYNYNVVKNNYISQYGSYLSYFGLDTSKDFSTQMYSDTLSWKDYFEQMAVESITTDKALRAEAEAAGFTHDTTEEVASYVESLKAAAQTAGVSVKEYVKQNYGSYATVGRIKKFMESAFYTNAYYTKVSEDKAATDEEITAYYEENKSDYDSVDYYMTVIDADIPTEPTELADPVEETAENTDSENTENTEDTPYQPSEAEKEKAMADAKELADAAVETVATEGELQENILKASAANVTGEWLFDESRKEGDTTVIEDATNFRYYVLSFVKRYRDESPSADVRIIAAADNNGQEILDEWTNGDATEESFAALADSYNEGTSFTAEGGLYQAVTPNGTQEELAAWIFDDARAAGDTASIDTAEGYNYVVYYVGPNDPKWKLDIADTLLADTMTQYLDEICSKVEVEDPEGNLNYLKVEAEQEAAEEAEAENTDAEEGTDVQTADDATDSADANIEASDETDAVDDTETTEE